MRNKYVCPHVLLRDGVYYYLRRVPYDLTDHYDVKRLCFSLKTKSRASAYRAAASISQRLEDYWMGIRLQKMDIPAITPVKSNVGPDKMQSPLLSEALSLYLRLKGIGKGDVFTRTATRNIGYVITLLGDKPIHLYSSADAAKFRDWLIGKKMSMKTVKRIFASVRAVINIAITEQGIECINGFAKTYFPIDLEETKRQPIPEKDIKHIQQLCVSMDDDMRWIIALISDSGMRLGEAVGLLKEDFHLDEEVAYVDVRPHAWRPLKTKGSQRRIPLVKASLWAAKRVVNANRDSNFAFPRYANEAKCNANSASNGLNKWLHDHAPEGCVIHSFRHSLRDRLRAVECPSDIVDAIGSWATTSVGQSYGNGYPLEVLERWLKKI